MPEATQSMMALLLYFALMASTTAEVVHREKSLYRNIVVRDTGERRCLAFSVKRQPRNQTCINLANPMEIVFPYVRMTFAGLLLNPAPEKLLMIGLGGGTIATVLADAFPHMEQDLVEVDPAVVKVARKYFGFRSGEKIQVHIQDGRVFTRRALAKGTKYDLIILDAFTGEYIPEHLMTREFLDETRRLLAPNGVLVANTFTSSSLYDHESVTYERVFGPFLNFKMPGTGNRVIVAYKGELPDDRTLTENGRHLADKLVRYSVDLQAYRKYLERDRDWNSSKRILTDQFVPANLLKRNRRRP